MYGPETHVTAIVPLALGLANPADYPEFDENSGKGRTNPPATSSAFHSRRVHLTTHMGPAGWLAVCRVQASRR